MKPRLVILTNGGVILRVGWSGSQEAPKITIVDLDGVIAEPETLDTIVREAFQGCEDIY